jgi:MoaA/NifB/PqqE/SkfB family radical SAM enzyme
MCITFAHTGCIGIFHRRTMIDTAADSLRSHSEIKTIAAQSMRFLRVGGLGRAWKLRGPVRNGFTSWWRRKQVRRRGGQAPIAIAISPTMRCNLSCAGCYAADYPRDDEISLETIDRIFSSAADLGVFIVVITGGEPLLREGFLDLLPQHRRLVFLMVTNGLLLDDTNTRTIARSGNIVPAVSIEGHPEDTNARRGAGVHEKAESAMELLKLHGVVFGFSTVVTRANWETLSSERFTDEMIAKGCVLGFHTEYVPVASGLDMSMVLAGAERLEFRQRILALRRTKPIIIAHLPDDEYDSEGRCAGVAGGTVHINSQGYVEPCPFCHYASDNIREKSLDEAIHSPFLSEIRSGDAIRRRSYIGCALVENAAMVREISSRTGAKRTDR